MSMTESSDIRPAVHPVLWLMAAVMAGFELLFAAADAGLVPADTMGRLPTFIALAFLDLRFEHALAGEGVSPPLIWSFVTHAFLHGGWLHLGLNGAAFLGLGHALVRTIGIGRFVVLFGVTAAAGALVFGLLAEAQGPLVGASGALFGMLAIITAWQERALRHAGRSRAPIWKRIAGLVALNVILDIGLGGLLAWEAHLGGWIAGWLMATLYRPQRGPLRL